ncbi:hypothetical protein Tsubulata_031553 [Turnera subulata]|uniref:F-box domain-containing protein n=1 Tax=Turnera subulata TaxID=218843 RepID=A0A9Q0GIU4_9ROSI|nr:hypothetical protein Tsubulata_031553 [Turnera subulata]
MELKSAKKNYGDAPTSFRRYDLLPDDALRLIFSKTSFIDHIRLKVVCKSWKKLLDGGDIRSTSILPWIMFYRWQPVDGDGDEGLVEGLCELYDPSHSKTYTLEDRITKRVPGSKEIHKFVGPEILDSKYGWVLFQKRTSMFMYCPFTSQVIDLPELDNTENLAGIKATFSCNPTSIDCLFFAFRRDFRWKEGNAASISLCRRGDHAWKTIQVLDSVTKSSGVTSVAYSNGAFYCVFDKGQLGAFNVTTERWELLFTKEQQYCSYYLYESDGRLFSITLTRSWLAGYREKTAKFKISRFDFSSRKWKRGASPARHRAAFNQAPGCQPMLIPAVGEATQLAGTLNKFSSTNEVRHYSFKTNENLPLLDAYSKATFSAAMDSVWIQPSN